MRLFLSVIVLFGFVVVSVAMVVFGLLYKEGALLIFGALGFAFAFAGFGVCLERLLRKGGTDV